MWHLLKRHPLPIQAFFRHSLVLTYAFPREILEPLLPPGLTLDTYEELGFLAIALVQTEGLRPVGAPRFLGRDFFLSGYRIFSRFTTSEGRNLRGLRILRSDTDSQLMALSGNALTHYHYQKVHVELKCSESAFDVKIDTPRAEADLQVHANLKVTGILPPDSPFPDLETARRFAGPLPFTFDYEHQTHSMVIVKGVRKKWDPLPVQVEVHKNTFLESAPFNSVKPRMANAFYIAEIPYRWEKGRVEPLPHTLATPDAAEATR
jgi:hypothetical protein